MTDYFKATHPDGRDFRTGTIDYAAALASGEVIRHPSAEMVRDDASTYLSVSVSAADCTGFSWPCRLFRVEPVGDVMDDLSDSPNKRAVSALRVVEELPAWQAFGPNGEQVVRLIARAALLTKDEASRLDAARDAARDAACDAARDAACDAAWDATCDAAWDATLACVVRDRLTDDQFAILAGPWTSVMGDPA